MIPSEPRRLGYYAASQWFQWAVLFCVLAALSIGLLWALSDVKERAEKLAVDLTVRNMRTGMQLAMGEALMHQHEAEIALWVGSNPVRWLSSEPKGYRGACSQAEGSELKGGEWCFDSEQKKLMYRPLRIDHLRESVGGHGCDLLTWRVTRPPDRGVDSGGFVGLRVEADSPCQWVLEEN